MTGLGATAGVAGEAAPDGKAGHETTSGVSVVRVFRRERALSYRRLWFGF
jgi:hypothetical protein